MDNRIIIRPQLILITLIGSLIMATVCTFGSPAVQIGFLGTFISILGGLALEIHQNQNAKDQELGLAASSIQLIRILSRDSKMLREFERIVDGISASLNIQSDLFRGFAVEQLKQLGQKSESLGNGVITFDETEAWRVAYETVLRSQSVSHYYSVAHITSVNYWQDEPGKHSMELNFRLQDEKRLNIERIAVISNDVWSSDQRHPVEPIFSWLKEQYDHGVWTELVREENIMDEQDLMVDIGRYGDIAVGHQILDDKSRTSRFILSFNPADIELAKQRWQRLNLFSVSLRELLDQE